MTSKILFSNLRWENIKHRLGMILIVFGMFFIYLLSFIMSVQNICGTGGDNFKETLNSITRLSEPGGAMGVLSVLSAILLGISGFRFLHSKIETDFYHSLPLRREAELFLTMTNDAGFFLALLVLTSALKCGIAAPTGYFTAAFIMNTMWSLLCYMLAFLVSYLAMALAMIMTGNTFVGILGYGVFASYSPLILGNFYNSLAQVFYNTYYPNGNTGEWFNYFSPVSLSNGLFFSSTSWAWRDHIPYLTANAVWVAVLLVINVLLFEKRASEMAGKAMAFHRAKPVIRVLLVIPAAIYGGLFMYSASFNGFKAWIIVGMLVGGFLTHGAIESIYRFDIKGLLAQKKQLIISMAVSFAIVAFFWLDVSGYDTFFPDEENLASILIDNPWIADDSTFWGKERNGVTGDAMENSLKVLEKIVEQNDQNIDRQNDNEGFTSYIIRYRMKGGKEKKRQYVLSRELTDELMEQVFGTQEYKRDTYSLYTADWSNVTGVEIWSPFKSERLELTREQRAELFRTYLEEHAGLDYETAKSSLPFGQLIVSHVNHGESSQGAVYDAAHYGEGTDYYFLYPCFKKTIRYLTEELDLDIETSMKNYDIKELKVLDNTKDVVIDDEEFIESVKGRLVYGEYLWAAGNDTALDMSCEIIGTVKTEGGAETYTFYTDEETARKVKEMINKL